MEAHRPALHSNLTLSPTVKSVSAYSEDRRVYAGGFSDWKMLMKTAQNMNFSMDSRILLSMFLDKTTHISEH